MEKCCRTGFRWEGTPTGKLDKLGDNDVYVSGDNKERAVLFCHDALGWEWNNARLLADHYAEEVGATVYIPDFFHGWSVNSKDVSIKVDESGSAKLETNPEFDFAGWFGANSPDVRLPEVLNCARILRERYSKVGAVGFCWGGGAGFRLAAKQYKGLLDCISIAHPAAPTEEMVRDISVPFQIIAPEHDPTFTNEWKVFCNNEIPKLGLDYDYQYFPGVVHGFATKCDLGKENEKKALERAKSAVVYWLATHL